MNRSKAHKAIYQLWMAQWHTLAGGTQNAPTVPYAIDNRKLPNSAAIFASVEINNAGSDQRTMGPPGQRRFERLGFIDVKLYGPRDQGRGQLDELAEHVKTIFEGTRIGVVGDERGIVTYATDWNELRTDAEFPDKWMLLVRTPYEFDERR